MEGNYETQNTCNNNFPDSNGSISHSNVSHRARARARTDIHTHSSVKWVRFWYIYESGGEFGQYLGSSDLEDLEFDNDWGSGEIAYGLSDMIGFISLRVVNLQAGDWLFTVGGDDGVRLYIDGILVIDGWKDQSYTIYSVVKSFKLSRNHLLRLEWYENKVDAHVSFQIAFLELSYPSDRWERLWYVYEPSERVLGSFLGLGPDQGDLNFDDNWGTGKVAHGRSDLIGFVSSRTVNVEEGNWKVTVGGDDGVRLYIDGEIVIDAWKDQSYQTYEIVRILSEGDHNLKLEWYESKVDARVSFSMEPFQGNYSLLYTSFFYRDFGIFYQEEDGSVFIYNGAYKKSPNKFVSTSTQTFECMMGPIDIGLSIPIYFGLVNWVTLPLIEDLHIQGDVFLCCWMSSTEGVGFWDGSGYAMGIVEVDLEGNIVWPSSLNEGVNAEGGQGKFIANEPTTYNIIIHDVDHVFRKGHSIMFIAGAACTYKDWTVTVYFNSIEMPSKAYVLVRTEYN